MAATKVKREAATKVKREAATKVKGEVATKVKREAAIKVKREAATQVKEEAATKVKEVDGPIAVRIQWYGPYGPTGQDCQSFLTHTKDDPLRRIFLDFCDALDILYSSVKFIFRGARVCESQTPRDLEMADGDVIDAIVVLRGC